ncbi:hypothetical protein AQ505_00655 [Pedobacter sp. PACM 27299]|uniref:anti-sigma factor family protein n=1 Tax=Pedobacter sp. PACM 27299 TaxID=1727164 RepID=UPI0007059201|nr:hypothetical protein [Pedobacter sp. PACM 27299]ALL04133.1 hypothetical protein AQ505_00655 [Pedobacter sp. PACM 27299]
MITIEEEIWDYIDGSSSQEQQLAVEAKIASDPVYRSLYQEFLEINKEMSGLGLEEPSMSFTRNVMEQVKLEIAPVSMKTKVDKRIIYSISGFFIFSMLAIVTYIVANSDFTFQDAKFGKLFSSGQLDFSKYFTPTFIKIFLFVDVLLAFAYLDSFLRTKRHSHQENGIS